MSRRPLAEMESVRVLVTGIGGGGHGHEVVKALRLANLSGGSSYHLIGVDVSAQSFGFEDVDEAYTVPLASAADYINVLLDLCRSTSVQVLIHGSEPELRAISRERARFSEIGVVVLVNSAEVIDLCMDKWATVNRLKDLGFKTATSTLVSGDAPGEIGELELPAVVKPSVGGGGSAHTYIVQSADELALACELVTRTGAPALVQEYVGNPDAEYTVGVLSSLDGKLAGSIALRRDMRSGLSARTRVKNRSRRPDLGEVLTISSGVSQGHVEQAPEVQRVCESLAVAVRSAGPLNVQCRLTDKGVIPFEINPRFSGTTHMRALMGHNEPDILIRHHLLGEPLPSKAEYRSGTVVRGLAERVVTGDVRAWTTAHC